MTNYPIKIVDDETTESIQKARRNMAMNAEQALAMRAEYIELLSGAWAAANPDVDPADGVIVEQRSPDGLEIRWSVVNRKDLKPFTPDPSPPASPVALSAEVDFNDLQEEPGLAV